AVVDGDGGIHEVAVGVQMSYAQLRDLTDAAGHRILVTIGARFVVVYRAQAVSNSVLLLESVLVVGKSVACWLRQAVALAGRNARRDSSGATGRRAETGDCLAGRLAEHGRHGSVQKNQSQRATRHAEKSQNAHSAS